MRKRESGLLDLAALTLLATGAVYALLDALLPVSRPLWAWAALTAACGLAVYLLARRWWIAPALAGAGALAIAALLLPAQSREALLAWGDGMLSYLRAGLPQTHAYAAWQPLVEAAVALPVAALFYLLLRRLFSLALFCLYALGLTFYLFSSGNGQVIPVLLLLLMGLILVLPRTAARRGGMPRLAVQWVAIPVALACVLSAYALVPKQDGRWKSQRVSAAFTDVDDLYRYVMGGEMETGDYGLRSVDLSPLGDKLGGDLQLSNEVVLQVAADAPALLGGGVQDTYSGQVWYDGWNNGQFRLDSLLWSGQQQEVFGLRLPLGGKAAKELYAKLSREVEMEITCLRPGQMILYHPGTPLEMEVVSPKQVPYFNKQGELFLTEASAGKLSYRLRARVLDRNLPGFDGNMLALERELAQVEDSRLAGVQRQYGLLPESLPLTVRNAAKLAAYGARTPYEQALRLEKWLADNTRYTLSPGNPPDGVDFVDHYLHTRQGYCVYSASAMTVLARCLGLPARYVTGYGLKLDAQQSRRDGKLSYSAQSRDAHAWAEIYFSGIGWVVFDPLRWNAAQPLEEAEGEAAGGPLPTAPPTPAPTPAPSASLSPGETAPGGQALGAQPRPWRRALPFAAAGLALALLGALAVKLLMRRRQRPYALSALLRRYGAGQVADRLYTDLLRQLSFYGVRAEPGETMAQLGQRASRAMEAEDMALDGVFAVMMRWRYGQIAPSRQEVEAMAALHASLEGRLRATLGAWEYFWLRALRR